LCAALQNKNNFTTTIGMVKTYCPLGSSPHLAQKSGRVSVAASSGRFAKTSFTF